MAIDPRAFDTEQAQLNMTPMIDIVFQLILFFLFSLKFKSLDFRIEAQMPKNLGEIRSTPVDIPPHLKASLFRVGAEDIDQARTKVRMAGREWILRPRCPQRRPNAIGCSPTSPPGSPTCAVPRRGWARSTRRRRPAAWCRTATW